MLSHKPLNYSSSTQQLISHQLMFWGLDRTLLVSMPYFLSSLRITSSRDCMRKWEETYSEKMGCLSGYQPTGMARKLQIWRKLRAVKKGNKSRADAEHLWKQKVASSF